MPEGISVSLRKEMLITQYMNPVFIETGTFDGGGVIVALEAGFPYVCSVEIDKGFYQRAIEVITEHFPLGEEAVTIDDEDGFITMLFLKSGQTVELFLGESTKFLALVTETQEQPYTFWLDAHYGNTPTVGKELVPLLTELDIISKNCVIGSKFLVDDRRLMGTDGPWKTVTEEVILKKLLEINPKFVTEYIDTVHAERDIIGAYEP